MNHIDKRQVSSRIYLIPQHDEIEIPANMQAAYSCFWFIGEHASKKINTGFKLNSESIERLRQEGLKIVSKTGTTKNLIQRQNQLAADMKKYPSPGIDKASRLVAQHMLEDRIAECVVMMVFMGLWSVSEHNTYTAEAKIKNDYLIPLGCSPENEPDPGKNRKKNRTKRHDIHIDTSEVPMLF